MYATNTRKEYKSEELFEEVADLVVSVRTPDSSGSGVLFGSGDIIATNKHVIENQKKVVIGTKRQQHTLGKVLRSYPDIDLAFVQIELSKATEATTRQIRQKKKSRVHSKPIRVGEHVFAIGHPLGLEYTFTQGIVSAVRRLIDEQEYLQIDASINPGNSGGGLFNKYGELIGINTMGYANTQGLNFAIPTGIVQQKYDEMLTELRSGALNYCAVCGFTSKDSKYCENCGSLLDSEQSIDELDAIISACNNNSSKEILRCNSCGTEACDTDKYCTSCGSEI